MGRLDTFLS